MSRQFLSLAQLRKEHEKNRNQNKEGSPKLYSSIGVIVDCSNVYKYEQNRDYTQKLKIIDSSSNNETLSVYLWSNRKEDFSLSLKVGDILLINNFTIDIYNDRLQAKKAYKNEDSYFRIFSGSPENINYCPVDKKVGLDDEDGKILNALNQLRSFSKTYFKSNRVPVVFKGEGQTKSKDPKKFTSSDFDMILRVVDCVQTANHFKVRLTNEKEEFLLNYPRYIEKGVYKLRSVAEVKWEDRICVLTGNDYTFFLEISNWMLSYDPKEWQRIATESSKKKVKRTKFECKALPSAKKVPKTTLKNLFSKDEHNEQVRVTCQIMDVRTSFESALRRYDAENSTEKNEVSESGEYIYSIHLLISDESLEGEVCNAYVYTFDGRGLEFLPDMHPNSIYGRNTLDMKEHYNDFVNRVVEESDFKDAPLELVLSPLFNGKETIYRIVDTQLLF